MATESVTAQHSSSADVATTSLDALSAGSLILSPTSTAPPGYSPTGDIVHTSEKEWQPLADLPEPLESFAACTLGGKIYAIGGITDMMGVQLQTRIYDPSTNEWSPGTNLTTARRDLAVAVLNDKIYAMGGRVGVDMVLDVNEIYDPDLNNWSDGAPLPTARSSHALVVLDGKIHSIGGYDGNGILTDHDVYDPGANTWDPAAPLPAVNSVPIAAGVVAGKIYAFFYSGKILEFDPSENNWKEKGLIPQKLRFEVGYCVFDGRIYLFGGLGSYTPTNSYSPVTDTWFHHIPMSPNRFNTAATVLDGQIHVMGGTERIDSMDTLVPTHEAYTPPKDFFVLRKN